ncbi:unnamed protein product [Cylicocyclus nassatus]|uniref:SHSP domain-containing protein n=1 Tax=Cylicocyclus nassatus TaxID=53992 RepID=A0AA36M6G5_CYLNA|nr:unnamed protein product [Cylicocyclus nassatus]
MKTGGIFEKCVRDLGSCVISCWEDPTPIEQKIADDFEVINDITRFAISIDVSQYKPEELHVYLIGRDLIIEGNQEKPDLEGYVQNTFSRRWTLPDEADLDAVETHLNGNGCLVINVLKTGFHTMRRELPIKVSSKCEVEKAILA